MLKPKLFEDAKCGQCLFCLRSGPSCWCDEKETFTGVYSPVCENFIPTVETAKLYKKKFGREGQ